MRAAVALGDVISKALYRLCIGVVPLHCDFYGDAFFFTYGIENLLMQHCFATIHILDEAFYSADECKVFLFAGTLVDECNLYPAVEERQFTQPLGEDFVMVFNIVERIAAGEEVDLGTALLGLANFFERSDRNTVPEFNVVAFSVAPYGKTQPFRKRVHNRHADSVQTAGYFVGVVVELASGVQLGHYNFCGGTLLFVVFLDLGRNPAPVVLHADRIIGMYGHGYRVAMTGQRFVYGIINDFKYHMVQAGAIAGVTNIHPRPLAHRLQSLEDLYAIGIIVIAVCYQFFVCHSVRFWCNA